MTRILGPGAPVVLADDDRDDCDLTAAAFERARVRRTLHCVGDGEKLLEYLRGCAAAPHGTGLPTSTLPALIMPALIMPALIMLDLNMPRMGGREALGAIKADARLRHIPVVIWTTSNALEDVTAARAAGCDDFLTKPDSFAHMIEMMQALDRRWLAARSLA